ncbi:MAG: xanthine dehydrogenase family protein molybdopterin-binding subunit, partial [Pseudomonadota bacterium]
MSEYSVIGKAFPQLDHVGKVKGEIRYVDDIVFPGMLHGKLLRSPLAHAKIVSIDTSNAASLPGVRAVVTGKDTSGLLYSPLKGSRDRQLLAIDKVRFIGEAVAAVAAEDEDIAEEAIGLIKVEYKELPAIFDPEEAMKDGAPKVHDRVKSNICLERHWDLGDVEKGFAESDYVREDTFYYPPNMHGFLEPDCCVASWDSTGKLNFWVCTQMPFYRKRELARILEIPVNKVRVIKPPTGGGFGGKTELFDHHLAAALLARKTRRPVKILRTRREEFSAALRGRIPVKIRIKTGVKKDGSLHAQQSTVISDGGAYSSIGAVTIYNHGLAHMLPYRLANFKHDAYRVYTNNPVPGPKRGHGQIQVRFAVDSQLDMIAEEMGMDAVEIRVKNALRAGDVTISKLKINTSGLVEAIERSAKKAGWKKKRGQGRGDGTLLRGIGISCGGFACGPKTAALSDSSCFIRLEEDGSLIVATGATDIGQGSTTVIAQIVAEVMGLRLEDISMVVGDTDVTPYDCGTFGSRVTFYAGNAAKKAAEDLRAQLAGVVARKWGVKPDDLVFRDRQVYVKNSPDKKLSFGEVARVAMVSAELGVVMAKATYYPPDVDWPDIENSCVGNIAAGYSFSTQIAEVEVDRETGQVRLVNMVLGDDCGRPLNTLACEGQAHGSGSNGQGEAMFEEVLMDHGKVLNPSWRDYKMPTAPDTPPMGVVHVITNEEAGPFGAKEIGEGFIISNPGAIANA